MARTVRDTNLETRAARLRLTARRKPYWRVLESGLHLGYRRTKDGGGTWVARRFIGEGRYSETKVWTANDLQGADSVAIRSFREAQEAAREWWRIARRREQGHAPEDGPYTVAKALDAYFSHRETRGSKGLAKDRAAANVRILPDLGTVELAKLTTRRLRDWHTGLASAPKLTPTGLMAKKRKSTAVDTKDVEAVRARRATANRTLTVLKAALNHAFHEGRVAADEPWRKVKPFREANSAVVRYLSADECRRIVNACPADFRAIVQGALVTGCRYGELCRMVASDFNAEAATVSIRLSKAGKVRHVALAEEGKLLFSNLTAGRGARDRVFCRADGKAWGPSHQQRPLTEASRIAVVEPAATFHVLRHTYGSSLAMKGVPMGVIAAQPGHSDTRMTEKHYAHLSPNYVADTIRAALPALGNVEKSNMLAMATR
jgi:integrase